MGLALCKHYANCCWTRHNRITQLNMRDFNVLLLGLTNTGKTEVGLILSKKARIQFEPTNGVQWYEVRSGNVTISVREIGGNDEMRKLWYHYYVKAMGLIYCYDMSASPKEMQISFQLLNKIASHTYMIGKPILLVATKSDLTSDTVQLYDIENSFALEDFANRMSSSLKSVHFNPNDPSDLWNGIDWLANVLQLNYNRLKTRINYDVAIAKSTINDKIKTNRFRTSYPCPVRPKTAPVTSTLIPTTSHSNNVFRIQQPMMDPVPTTSGTN